MQPTTQPAETPATILDAARDYAAGGWAVIPLHSISDGVCTCCKSDCSSPGKHPRTANGLKDASKDFYQIADWWRQWPDANIGIATGEASGFVALDIDKDKGGCESLDQIEAHHSTLPATVTACTGGGGFHFYFQHPGGAIRNRTGLWPGIDDRGDGGYVVAPPSNHISDDVYRFDEARGPDEVALAELPAWLLEALRSETKPDVQRNGTPATGRSLLLQRASQYVAKADAAAEGYRNTAAFGLAGNVAALVDDAGGRLAEGEIFDVLRQWNLRNSPPLDELELSKAVASTLVNGTPRPEKIVTASGGLSRLSFGKREVLQAETPQVEIVSFGELHRQYPRMKPPVIEGLFRQCETTNVISVTKAGKSWLVYDQALSIISGQPWLGQFNTWAGNVLLIDNELHPETLSYRIPQVAEAKGMFPEDYENSLDILSLRGNLLSWTELTPYLDKIVHGHYRVILFDAKYRFTVPGVSENENAADALVYNLLDRYAAQAGAAFVLVHHSSKGSQSEKRVTDVGAGAQSRAADCHLILREHEDEGVFVLDAAVRSFPPVAPLALRWQFPLWLPDGSADPCKLKGKLTAGEQRQAERDREGMLSVAEALQDGPATARAIRDLTGLSKDRAERLLSMMLATGEIVAEETTVRGNTTNEYRLATSTD